MWREKLVGECYDVEGTGGGLNWGRQIAGNGERQLEGGVPASEMRTVAANDG